MKSMKKHADRRLVQFIKALYYKDETAVIQIQNNVKEIKINEKVGQDCTLSLIILNTYIQEAIDKKNKIPI